MRLDTEIGPQLTSFQVGSGQQTGRALTADIQAGRQHQITLFMVLSVISIDLNRRHF